MKITKDSSDIAKFSYDALGRRIKKEDVIDSNNSRLYCYNDNWQILCEYKGENYYRMFVYGNYIDEVIYTQGIPPGSRRHFVHDHLYNTVALVYINGPVWERYEYDAYGNPYIMDAGYNPCSKSGYDNPYLFTGRYVDFLDNGKLTLQDNRHRYYDYYTGRWLTHDPMGITPEAEELSEELPIISQYEEGLNLYMAFSANPMTKTDAYGLASCDICGPEVGYKVDWVLGNLRLHWNAWTDGERKKRCKALYNKYTRSGAWDMVQLHDHSWIAKKFPCCATSPNCTETVAVMNKCYDPDNVNYVLWGVMNAYCGNTWAKTRAAISIWKWWSYHHGPDAETIAWAKLGFEHGADALLYPLPASPCPKCETRCRDFHGDVFVPNFTWHWSSVEHP